ncbi:LysR family transcriptional regulator [Agromyces marinus]|uniref:LysR family transcriptional regulator n=1 Tax=Agromyces marinus TaxID=1389020 RepID=A0ABN6YBC9_9MICO|nr:LysR family transcriptional regulator [Agromyces marinus]UIP58514.1 Nodulation protein D 2 [Agromyces marinus]BDZ53220.1 LysR family transcriptional regulator [Agromyces marinus]
MTNEPTASCDVSTEPGRTPLQLSSVDLNLVVPLQTLLEERSVSRAAERLFMSQPALSAALARLRRHFNDELLIRSGNRYELSPLGVELLESVINASNALSRVFAAQAEFRPHESTREFRLVCSDYVSTVFGAVLAREFSQAAPNAMLRMEHVQDAIVDGAPDSLREIDGLILPHGYLEHIGFIDLFSDRWRCLVAIETAATELTVEALGARPWATTYSGRTAIVAATRELHVLGVYPRTQVTTRSFLTLPDMVADTDRVAFVPASLVERFERRGDVLAVDCPISLPDIKQAFWWSPTHEQDAGHRWFRSLVERTAQSALRP